MAKPDRPGGFADSTVLVAGAACDVGVELCHAFAGAGARVVAVDPDEASVLGLGRHAPDRIDTLALDVMQPVACRRLGNAWADEPLHVLLHLLPLRSLSHPAAAMAAAETLTRALSTGLRAGRGRVLIVAAGAPRDASVTAGLLHDATRRLAPALQVRHASGGVTVNAILLPGEGAAVLEPRALWHAVAYLAAPGTARPCGAIVPLAAFPAD
ncbi:hypothetical protein [Roseovarius salis]|uniref:hypothetical protein n=1 Tax=Roseovarius salis TaxID=3376063 RepID=UPI0037CBC820